jgi:DNA-binding NarL/FixJ family response regulator
MRFLLVEDHPLMSSGMAQLLARQFPAATVTETPTAAQALSVVPSQGWDLIILDIDLPDRSGLDLLVDLRSLAPQIPVLMLTGQDEREFGRRVLQAGAAGFVHKSAPTGEIISAVKRLLQGGKYISPDLAAALVDSMNPGGMRRHDLLSSREFEVLRSVARGCSVGEIAAGLNLSIKTVSTYKTRILEKLELRTTADLIRYAIEHRLV